MSKSPYIPPEVKAYIEQYKIEEIIKDAVNSILTQKPTDPYTTFS
jgi:enolase